MVNVESFIVDASIASLKVVTIVEFTGTPVAPSIGFVETTVGGVVSAFVAYLRS